MNPTIITPAVADHLRRNNLRAWKIVSGEGISEVLRNLARSESRAAADKDDHRWSSYVFVPEARGKLIGENRLQVAQQLVALIKARRASDPLPTLAGLQGAGKHTVCEDAAARLKLVPIELPAGRLLIQRVLRTSQELLLDTLLSAKEELGDGELLLVTDAQLIWRLPPMCRHLFLQELSRLPHAVLLADGYGQELTEAANVVTLACPGLSGAEEALELINLKDPQLQLVGSVLKTICRYAWVHGVGIVPARLLYIVRLGRSLIDTGAAEGTVKFSPDDVTPAAALAEQAWNDECPSDPVGDRY